MPGAAPGDRTLRPAAALGGLALHRELLPGRRRHLPASGLPRRRRAARGHERRALPLARRLDDQPRRHRPHARHREQRQGDLRRVRPPRGEPGQRHHQPVQRVLQLRRPSGGHGPRAGEGLRGRIAGAAGSAFERLRGGHRLRRDSRRRRCPQGTARNADRRGRAPGMPHPALQRLWRAQHPGRGRQARAADFTT